MRCGGPVVSEHGEPSAHRDPGEQPSGRSPLYSALPLPSGESAADEAGLLAQALVGCQPVTLETQLAVQREMLNRKIQLGFGILHVSVLWNGRDVGERWIELAETHGHSHSHGDVPEGAADTPVITVDIGDGLAKGRLARLISAIEEITDERDLIPLRNALAVCHRAELDEPDPALLSLATELTDKYLVPTLVEGTQEWLNAIMKMPGQPDFVMDKMARCRSKWSIDAHGAAAMLVIGSLPSYCAEAEAEVGTPTTSVAVFIRYLKRIIGAILMGDPYQVFYTVGSAVRDGYRDAMESLASNFHDKAIAHSEAALSGPPERMQFGRELAIAAPYALAAYLVARQLDPDQSMNQRATAANELYVRISDGLIFQWSDWIGGGVAADRNEYLAAIARGDKIAAWKVLKDGEQRFRWPRSVKDLFTSNPEGFNQGG